MKQFGEYSKYYDLLYSDKDYSQECDFVEEIFQNYSVTHVKTILDGGCGTAGHAIPLANKGYKVTGIDASEAMVKRAREKSEKLNLNIDFRVADLCQFELGTKFDACISMFAAVSYITETENILRALSNIRHHLETSCLFIFDVWNGLAVLRQLPSVRVKSIEAEKQKIIRIVQPELDAFNHLCRVHYHLLVAQDNSLMDDIEETHTVRYLFPQEITHYLKDAGFETLKICPFLNLNGIVDENIWNITVIARAI
jgi:SAM-dependent methyltransferase